MYNNLLLMCLIFVYSPFAITLSQKDSSEWNTPDFIVKGTNNQTAIIKTYALISNNTFMYQYKTFFNGNDTIPVSSYCFDGWELKYNDIFKEKNCQKNVIVPNFNKIDIYNLFGGNNMRQNFRNFNNQLEFFNPKDSITYPVSEYHQYDWNKNIHYHAFVFGPLKSDKECPNEWIALNTKFALSKNPKKGETYCHFNIKNP